VPQQISIGSFNAMDISSNQIDRRRVIIVCRSNQMNRGRDQRGTRIRRRDKMPDRQSNETIRHEKGQIDHDCAVHEVVGRGSVAIDGVRIPDSRMAQDLRQLVRDTETDLLFNHSTRVYLFGALTGQRRALKFDPELLYVGAMFHDIGLTERYQSSQNRFEVDSANAARDFLRSYHLAETEVDTVWDAIALHTTPGIPEHKKAEVALVTSGVEMDVMGLAYDQFTEAQREAVVAAYPRGPAFKKDIIHAFYNGMMRRPDSTFGTVNDDVLAYCDPKFERTNFCSIILQSSWRA
jgi:HD domain